MTGAEADVIVVGCGPVGVMTALRCTQRGLRVIAVDQSTEVYPLPRAIGMDDEIQRLFASAGLLDELRANSTPLLGAEFVDADGERVVGFDLEPGSVGPLGHPRSVMFDQPGIERALRRAAVDAGVELQLGWKADSFDIGHDAVRIGSSETGDLLEARWLVGADGASSTVRKQLSIRLEDQGFDQPWLVVDTTLLDPDLDLPPIARQCCDPNRITTFVPGHGTRRRWEFQLRAGEEQDDVLAPSFIAGLLRPWGSPSQLQVDRSAVYRFHATVAERFDDDPVFLAGDSAHQMPPFNGQGMCTGMRDADNLAWKLAMVALGHADHRLLATYDAERRPHATGQVAHSVDAGRLIDAIAAGGRADIESGYGGGRPFPHLEHGVLVGSHPAVGRPLPQPVVAGVHLDEHLGDWWALLRRRPLDHADAAFWRQFGTEIVVIDDPVGGLLDADTTVVVRPDRYVAAVTDDLAATTGFFADQLTVEAGPH